MRESRKSCPTILQCIFDLQLSREIPALQALAVLPMIAWLIRKCRHKSHPGDREASRGFSTRSLVFSPRIFLLDLASFYYPVMTRALYEGVGTMPYGKFLAYNVGGAILWSVLFVGAGAFLGNLPAVKHNFSIVRFPVPLNVAFRMLL